MAVSLAEYVEPGTENNLTRQTNGLVSPKGELFPFLADRRYGLIPDFVPSGNLNAHIQEAFALYNKTDSIERYGNELAWLYDTFGVKESEFRQDLIARLRLSAGQRVLITACGLGHDIRPAMNAVGPEGRVFAQDIAAEMVLGAAQYLSSEREKTENVLFSVSDATKLPFRSGFFDAVFHFGGINLFENVPATIAEMARVTRKGGRVVFGDESVAPWLREIDYGRAAINNNSLWRAEPPLSHLPATAVNVNLSWVFGNCFYVIEFEVSENGPFMNMDVPHKGLRGGTMRTRYFGKLEGVSEEIKQFVLDSARQQGMSISQWLENLINAKKKNSHP